ncbi:MAG: hypothetical protein WCB19_07420 [Thermoplasmata archaeon]
MNRVKFSADWDKLDGPRFTTVRTYRPEKHAYYQSKVGEKFTILRVPHEWSYKGRKIGEATLRSVSVVVPGELPALEIQREVSLGGKPDQVRLSRLLAMPKALLLEFENHTGILGMKG